MPVIAAHFEPLFFVSRKLLALCLTGVGLMVFNPHTSLAEETSKTLTIAADEWCPINCTPDKAPLGIGIDLAKAAFEPLGYQIKYVTMPWTRALEEVRKGTVDAVVGANTTDDPTLVFPKSPLYFMTDDFYALKGHSIAFKDMNSLKAYKVGTIKGYGYSGDLANFIKSQSAVSGAIQEVSGDDAGLQNIRKLQAKRIDVMVESGPVMSYRLKQMNLTEQIVHVGSLPQDNIFIGFSQAKPESKQRAQQFDEAVARLRKDGKITGIYAAYNLEAPKTKP